jgi:hypothetical protein
MRQSGRGLALCVDRSCGIDPVCFQSLHHRTTSERRPATASMFRCGGDLAGSQAAWKRDLTDLAVFLLPHFASCQGRCSRTRMCGPSAGAPPLEAIEPARSMQSGKGEAGKPRDSNFKVKALGDADVSVPESYLRALQRTKRRTSGGNSRPLRSTAMLTHLAARRHGSSATGVSA